MKTRISLKYFVNDCSLVVMFDQEKKQFRFRFNFICGPKANNWSTFLIFFVKVLFIGKEWLSLLTLLKAG